MYKTAAALLIGLAAASAHAVPIVFDSVLYTTSAFADVDGTADGPNADDTGLSPLPLISTAGVGLGSDNLAAANAVADTLLLAASSEAASTGSLASAAATATFLGSFTTGIGLDLQLVFEDLIDAQGGAGAGSELFVLLQVDGVDLLNQSYTSAQPIQVSFPTLAGLAGVLDLTLISTAAADGAGTGFNLASASFALDSQPTPIPEPAGLALVLGGLGLLGLGRGRDARRPA